MSQNIYAENCCLKWGGCQHSRQQVPEGELGVGMVIVNFVEAFLCFFANADCLDRSLAEW